MSSCGAHIRKCDSDSRPGHEPARHFPRRARAFTIYSEARAFFSTRFFPVRLETARLVPRPIRLAACSTGPAERAVAWGGPQVMQASPGRLGPFLWPAWPARFECCNYYYARPTVMTRFGETSSSGFEVE